MRKLPKLSIQIRVLFALVMREMATRYGRSAGGYVWALLEPVGVVAVLTLIFAAIARRPPLGDSFAVFFATGYMAFHVYADISRAVSLSVATNRTLLTFPRVTILDTILARLILQLMTALFVTLVVLTGAIAVFGEPVRLDPAAIFAALSLAAGLGLAVGMLNCVLFSLYPTWQTAFAIINRPLFLISGIFFLFEDLPLFARDALWWNPLMHVTALMRQGFFAAYTPQFVSVLYVAFMASGLLCLGGMLLRAMRNRMLEQ